MTSAKLRIGQYQNDGKIDIAIHDNGQLMAIGHFDTIRIYYETKHTDSVIVCENNNDPENIINFYDIDEIDIDDEIHHTANGTIQIAKKPIFSSGCFAFYIHKRVI